MTRLQSLPANQWGVYAIATPDNPVTVSLDGQPQQVDTSGVSHLSHLYYASTIALPSGSTSQVVAYTPIRSVF
jgi:hypothetical protein